MTKKFFVSKLGNIKFRGKICKLILQLAITLCIIATIVAKTTHGRDFLKKLVYICIDVDNWKKREEASLCFCIRGLSRALYF